MRLSAATPATRRAYRLGAASRWLEPALSAEDFPWRLRLKHLGHAAISVERPRRHLVFDPVEAPTAGELIVLTGEESDRLLGATAAVEAGTTPEIVASQKLIHWLGERGELIGQLPPIQVDGLAFDVVPYTPIPYATPAEAVRKAWSGLRHPDRAARRIKRKLARPGSQPLVVQITLPDGGRLVHLGCALSSFLPEDERRRLVQRFVGADWIIVGCDYGEQDAVLAALPAFEARVVLVTDLINQGRRSLGMPTELLTPLVDQLCEQGIQAHAFSWGASYRFE